MRVVDCWLWVVRSMADPKPATCNEQTNRGFMATVKLLLKESIKNVGKVGDIVDVSPGYARNYLLPHDLAVEPTPGNVKKVEARRKEIEKQERERLEQQAALIATLAGVEVHLERRANEQG